MRGIGEKKSQYPFIDFISQVFLLTWIKMP